MVGVAFQQGSQHQQPVEGLALRFGLHGAQQPQHPGRAGFGRVTVGFPAAFTHITGDPPDDLGDVVTAVLGQHCQRLRHQAGQPRIGPELHPVGDLVQAHPHPEVGWGDA